VEERGLAQSSDVSAIEEWCAQAITANAKAAADFRRGHQASLNFLKGQVLKLSKGRANPQLVGKVLERMLHSA
jgi:aspartyl-tRNA(Asn)/glutamyl-tRNA(Gln) amidotransferase subunit B